MPLIQEENLDLILKKKKSWIINLLVVFPVLREKSLNILLNSC